MQEDAQGFLLNLVPIVLRCNIQIVNINTNQRDSPLDVQVFNLEDNKAEIEEMKFSIPNDGLDFHKEVTLAVLRKDGHYDALYSKDCFKFDLASIGKSDKDFFELHQIIQKRQDGQLQNSGIMRLNCCQQNFTVPEIKNRMNLPMD